jgi:hypothetical protein
VMPPGWGAELMWPKRVRRQRAAPPLAHDGASRPSRSRKNAAFSKPGKQTKPLLIMPASPTTARRPLPTRVSNP